MTKITSMGQYHGTKRINNIRSTNKNNAIGAQKKSLQEAIVYHEKRADKYLQLFNESIPKLQIMLNENNPALNPVIRDYSLAIPLTPPFINKNSPDHLLFQDYIDGIWLLSGLEIYTGIMYLKLKVPKNDSLYEESAIRQIHGLNQYALHLKHKLTELKARLDSLPPFCNAKEHNYSIVLSLGPHEIEADEYYFDNLVSEYQPNLVILEHLFNYHSNLLLDPRTLEETSSFYKYEYSPFQSELFRLIKRSKDFNLTFRYIENLPIHEIVEAYSLYLKNEDSPLRLYDIDSDLQLNFSNSSILHRASSMREKNILQNIRELLENFDFYFPRLANNKDISIFMRYGGAHFVLAKELMKLSPENLGVYLSPDPGFVGHMKVLDELGYRNDNTFEAGFDIDIAKKMLLNEIFREAPFEGLGNGVLRSLLHYAFVKRANFERVFDRRNFSLLPATIMRQELLLQLEHHDSLKKILIQDHPEYRNYILQHGDIL